MYRRIVNNMAVRASYIVLCMEVPPHSYIQRALSVCMYSVELYHIGLRAISKVSYKARPEEGRETPGERDDRKQTGEYIILIYLLVGW